MVLAIVAVGVLGLLSFVVYNLNNRLDNQQAANVTSIAASQGIVDVNDKLTGQLQQLTQVTHTAQDALDATAALEPLLGSSTSGAVMTNDQLNNIKAILGKVDQAVVPLVASAEAFGGQGGELLVIVQGLVDDLAGSVDAAYTINQMLPLPG